MAAALVVIIAAAGALGALLATRGGEETDQVATPSSTAPASPVSAASPPVTATSATDMVERVQESVAVITTASGSGSGFLVGPQLIMTSAHVVEGYRRVTVRIGDGPELAGEIQHTNSDLDLALLSAAEANGTALDMYEGDLKAGCECYAVGSPLGLEQSVSGGVVSNPSRVLAGVRFVQVDAPINPGNSGGPIVDAEGKVIGIVTAKLSETEGMGFGVAYSELASFLSQAGLGHWAPTSTTPPQIRPSTTSPGVGESSCAQALGALYLALQRADSRIPILADEINATCPNVPESVHDELSELYWELDKYLAMLLSNETPSRYSLPRSYILQAADNMRQRIEATAHGIEAMWMSGSVSAGESYFDAGRRARDAFRADIAKYEAAMTSR